MNLNKEMIVDKTAYKRFFKGFVPYDCAYGFEDRLAFVLLGKYNKKTNELPKKFLFIRREREMEKRFYAVTVQGESYATLSSNINKELSEIIIADTGRQVFQYNKNKEGVDFAGIDKDIDGEIGSAIFQSTIRKVVRVDNTIYAVGKPCIYKRIGITNWEKENIPIPKDLEKEEQEFQDMSGFSTSEMFAVGLYGLLWQKKANNWQKLPFPSDENLRNVCCGGDGNVYVVAQSGSIYQKEGNDWKLLLQQDNFEYYNDIAWFAGKLWLASDGELHTFENNQISKNYPKSINGLVRRLDVSPCGKYLLTCGELGAAIFDGTTWQILWNSRELEK